MQYSKQTYMYMYELSLAFQSRGACQIHNHCIVVMLQIFLRYFYFQHCVKTLCCGFRLLKIHNSSCMGVVTLHHRGESVMGLASLCTLLHSCIVLVVTILATPVAS